MTIFFNFLYNLFYFIIYSTTKIPSMAENAPIAYKLFTWEYYIFYSYTNEHILQQYKHILVHYNACIRNTVKPGLNSEICSSMPSFLGTYLKRLKL